MNSSSWTSFFERKLEAEAGLSVKAWHLDVSTDPSYVDAETTGKSGFVRLMGTSKYPPDIDHGGRTVSKEGSG
jgi:hypothetical protein